jgi:uncharacterized membrane protein
VRVAYAVHILAGALALLSGFVALYARKGAALHRRSGTLFVRAMLTMCAFGTFIAIARSVAPALNVSMGVLTAYLVVTSLTTVRPPAAGPRWLDRGLMLVVFAVGGTMLAFGIEALVTGRTRDEIPALPFLLFGVIALLAGAGDLRVVRSGAPTGAARLARHLWRMSFALFIAAMSFFIGQAKVFPKPVRILPLLALPVLAVLATMLYWLWRVRVRRTLRGLVVGGAPRVA